MLYTASLSVAPQTKCICPCWPFCTTFAAHANSPPAYCDAFCHTPLADKSYMHVRTFLGRGQTSVRRAVILSLHVCWSPMRLQLSKESASILRNRYTGPQPLPHSRDVTERLTAQKTKPAFSLNPPLFSIIVDETLCVGLARQKLLVCP